MAGIPRALKFDFELVLRRLAVTRDSLNDFRPQPPDVWIVFCFPIQLYCVATGFWIYSFNPNRVRSIPIWTEFIFITSRRDQFLRLPRFGDGTRDGERILPTRSAATVQGAKNATENIDSSLPSDPCSPA